MSSTRMTHGMALLLAVLSLGGCYNYTAIRPTELPLLNNMHVIPVGSTTGARGQTVSVTQVSVRTVHRQDGRTVRIAGTPSVRIQTTMGEIDFDDPVMSSLQPGQSLTVAGANRSAVTIPLGQVQLVEARELSVGKSVALMVAISIVVIGATSAVTWAAIQ